MKKRNKVIAIFAIITMCLAATLGAQQSSQNVATAGVYGDDADNFVDVNYYGDVEFGKWFGYVGSDTGYLDLGYATKFGSIYLGAYYSGNALDKKSSSSKSVKSVWDTDLQKLLTSIEQDGGNRDSLSNPNNSIDLLIGVAGMGFKLGFSQDYTFFNSPYYIGNNRDNWSSKEEDVIAGITNYYGNDSINYEETIGWMAPSFQWGMKLDLGGSKVLAPRLGARIAFHKDELIDEYYTDRAVYNDKTIGTEKINNDGWNNGYTALNAGAGLDFYLNESMYVGIDYALGINFYDQSFGQAGRSGSVEGFIIWQGLNETTGYVDRTEKTNTVSIDVDEKSYMSHVIAPALWKELSSSNNAKFGIKVSVPVLIESYTSNIYSDSWTVKETTYTDTNRSNENEKVTTETHTAGLKEETSVLLIAPSISFGGSYEVIPGKFIINAGVNVRPVTYKNTSTTKATNGLDSKYTKKEIGSGATAYTDSEEKIVSIPVDPDWSGGNRIADKVDSSSEITGLRSTFGAGFKVNFSDNFALDLAVRSDSTANVAFTVKY